ncbi:MAG TPA: alpha/beta fold hydrolase [Stellaceae bacterium]|jgi:homoserine O-acetyltransferase|nr:alpha/beta fold hydrolase [Stellaceae bacterium]
MPVSGPRRRSAGRSGLLALLALVFTGWAGPGWAGDATIYTIPDFKFEDGSVLPELRIAYETQGKLSPNGDNAIVAMPGARGGRDALAPLIGPGKTIDTDKYFVITADAIGGGGSSSPADGTGQEFPRYTVRDMMEAQHALVTAGLKLTTLRAVVGRSMGAFTALEWAIHHPALMRGVVLIAPSPKAEANFQLVIDVMNSVITLDPEWQGGRYEHNPEEGLRRAGLVYYPWNVSAAYLERVSAKRLGEEMEAEAKSFASWDANSLVFRYAACREHDVSAPFGGDMSAAFAQIRAPVLILASASDRLLGLYGTRRIRDGVKHATYVEIPSDMGHRGLGVDAEPGEAAYIVRAIKDFLGAGK